MNSGLFVKMAATYSPAPIVLISSTIGATVLNHTIALNPQYEKSPKFNANSGLFVKMAATYSPAGVQYHRRDCA